MTEPREGIPVRHTAPPNARASLIFRRSCVLALLILVPAAALGRARPEEEPALLAQYQSQTGPAASKAAYALGEIGSVPGLNAIIARRDPQDLNQYRLSYQFAPADHEAAIEQILIEHYADPVLGPHLVWLLEGHRYHTRALFDLLAASIRNPALPPSERSNLAAFITSTDLPLDDDVLALLRSLPPAGSTNDPSGQIIRQLGKRRYEPLASYLGTVIRSAPPQALGNECQALAQIGSKESLDLVVDCVRRLSVESRGSGAVDGELGSVLGQLAGLPPTAPLSFPTLKSVLPVPLGKYAVRPYIALIRGRREIEGVPDLIAYLRSDPAVPGGFHQAALEALLDFDSPEVWQRTREEIEREHASGQLADQAYQFASRQLDERLRDPAQFSARKRVQERAAAEEHERDDECQRRTAALSQMAPLQREDPRRYVEERAAYLAGLEGAAKAAPARERQLCPRMQLAHQYSALAGFARFAVKDPARSLALYEQALELEGAGESEGTWVTRLDVADLYAWDLHDPPRAIQQYEKARDDVRLKAQSNRPNEVSEILGTWLQRWLDQQIRYLQTGKPFVGPVDRSDVAGAFTMILMVSAAGDSGMLPALDELSQDANALYEHQSVDTDRVRRVLMALPHGYSMLARTLPLLAFLPADGVGAYLEAQDPGRYWSACFLGAAITESRSPASDASARHSLFPTEAIRDTDGRRGSLLLAADRFSQQTGIHFALDPDPRFTSPEKTWQSFLAALNGGDAPGALSCFVPPFRNQLEPLFAQMSRAEMREMAASFTALSPSATPSSEVREYGVSRLVNGEQRAALVSFGNDGGEWKIYGM